MSANFETPFGENGAAQSTKQATDKDGNLLYTDKNGNTTVNSKGVDGKENTKKLAEGKESLQFSYGMGYGKDSDSQSSTLKNGKQVKKERLQMVQFGLRIMRVTQ